MNIELNCLSNWFPKIEAAGLPVPKTIIVRLPDNAHEPIFRPFDGRPMGDECKPFFAELRAAVEMIGTPCFLRTGQTSGKHNWKDTCFLTDLAALEQHVLSLIDFSECCGFIGLPWGVWCVRELLPTEAVMVANSYGNMPVCREFRFFVRDGKPLCFHPYWPLESLVKGMSECPANLREAYQALCSTDDYASMANDFDTIESLAIRAGEAVGGSWSVDILHTLRGWYVTDMAVASDSWHWPGCEQAASLTEKAEAVQ